MAKLPKQERLLALLLVLKAGAIPNKKCKFSTTYNEQIKFGCKSLRTRLLTSLLHWSKLVRGAGAEQNVLHQTQPKLNYVARRRSDEGSSDRGGRQLPIARVGPMSISRSRIARRSVFRWMPSLSAA